MTNILKCACCGARIADLSFLDWSDGETRPFECGECGCWTKVEASVSLETTSDAVETRDELRRLAMWNGCEFWYDTEGVLRIYPADDLGGCELAALWMAPETGYEEAAGLHVTVDGRPLPVDVYDGLVPREAAKVIWKRIGAIL